MGFGGRRGGAAQCRYQNIVEVGVNLLNPLVELGSLYEMALVVFSVHEILEVGIKGLYP